MALGVKYWIAGSLVAAFVEREREVLVLVVWLFHSGASNQEGMSALLHKALQN